jgi:AcrR family transcriptional regulator
MPAASTPTADRRQHLLDVARALFASRGFVTTTMDDLAEAAGFTKPIVYQHFAGKEALYAELVTSTGDDLIERLTAAVADSPSPEETVRRGFSTYFHFLTSEPDAFRLLFLQNPHSTVADYQRALEVRLMSFVEPLLIHVEDDAHRTQLAAAVVGLAEGAALVWLVENPTASHDPAADAAVLTARMTQLAWGGLRSLDRAN